MVTSGIANPNAALRFAIIGATMAMSNVISLFVLQAICNYNSRCRNRDHMISPQGYSQLD